MKQAGATTLLALCCLLSGCGSQPSQQAALAQYQSAQKTAARQAEQQGRLFEALNLWRSLLPLDAVDAETLDAISALEREIKTRVTAALRSGRAAYKSGRTRSGDTWMLKVLALQPGQDEALDSLRRSALRRAQAEQAAKSEEENELRMSRMPAAAEPGNLPIRSLYEAGDYQAVLAMAAQQAGEPNGELSRLLRASHIALADQAKQGREYDLELYHLQAAIHSQAVPNDPLLERSARLRVALSKDWYRKGYGLMTDDLPGAIAALEKSVAYNPQNNTAKLKLKQARTLQQNLERIQGR